MTKSFNKKQIGLAVACALALSILSGAARAQDVSPQTAKDRELVQDTRVTVVTSGFGLCWHSGFGPPPAPGPKCDPNYVAYVEPPVLKAVAVVPPAMAPAQPPAVVVAPEPPQIYVPPQRPARRDRN
jgi:OOP family OmpA-OmpF porin